MRRAAPSSKAEAIRRPRSRRVVVPADGETSKRRIYQSLKRAIVEMDIYGTEEPVELGERRISKEYGVSRTPVREAIAMLEYEGFVRTIPRRGVVVVRKTRDQIIEIIEAWAALEAIAARLVATKSTDEDVAALREIFTGFEADGLVCEALDEYSQANIAFHQAIIRLSGSQTLVDLTEDLLLHVRAIRRIAIGQAERRQRSIDDHFGIIDAIERRDADRAERLSRQHTLGLAAFVETHGDRIFG
ncbi:GntR family transcriptional regulator [Methylobrevis pamukkalensis]|uniref:Putative HTH-type transcriptional regulator YdfH n=1 Tax=Methylobrevis pamukkalensis TaxID=1439726 RepID=A0A1E3GXG0_9HYPH|nr:GntR family transcriptional regulator [Methylobrevis pamukkalensis]ODN68748.1 putative HTH-type transcriptional regulator YdfH [Methylobrevis pamukkalensis]